MLPLAAPGIAATAIFAFVVSWSELLFAISFTTETNMRTLSAGLLYMVNRSAPADGRRGSIYNRDNAGSTWLRAISCGKSPRLESKTMPILRPGTSPR